MGKQQCQYKHEKTQKENNPEIFLQRAGAKMAPAPAKDIFDLGNCKVKTDMLRFVQPLLHES